MSLIFSFMFFLCVCQRLVNNAGVMRPPAGGKGKLQKALLFRFVVFRSLEAQVHSTLGIMVSEYTKVMQGFDHQYDPLKAFIYPTPASTLYLP